MQTRLKNFRLFFLNVYQNLLANDIQIASRNFVAFRNVCPLSIIAFENSLLWISLGCDPAPLCVNPNDSILDVSLIQGISFGVLSSTGEEAIIIEFDAIIGVLTLEFNKIRI